MRLLLLYILTFVFLDVFAQVYNFRNYTVQDGISQSTINNLFQDSKGFLWFSTQKGFVCFDGIKFTNYTTKDGLPGNIVNLLYKDSKNKFWITTSDGICYWDKNKFFLLPDADKVKNVTSVLEANNGNFYIATNNNVIFCDGKSFVNLIFPDSLLPIREFYKTKRNQIFCACKTGLYQWKNEKISEINFLKEYRKTIFHDFTEDNTGNIWCATSDGLLKISKTNTIEKIIPDIKFESITIDLNGDIWLGAEYGLLGFYDGTKFTKLDTENGISNLSIIDLYVDLENNLWIGGRNGLTKLPLNNPFLHFNNISRTDGIIILGMYADKNNILWASTYGNGIIGIKNNKIIDFPLTLKDNRFFDVLQDKNNNFVLASASLGVIVYDTLKRKVLQTICVHEDTRVYCLFRDSKDNIWAGTNNSGAIKITDGIYKFYSTKEGLLSDKVMSVGEDKNGTIWIGQIDGGISKCVNNKIYSYGKDNGFPASYVRAITCSKTGKLYMGTATHGIVHVKEVGPGIQCSYIREKDGLNSDNIYLLQFDSHGYLWAGTELGLNRISFDSQGEISEIKQYSAAEGFVFMETNINSFYEDAQQNLWFGNTSGITKYIRDLDVENTKEVQLYITDIKLFFEKTDWKQFSDSLINNIPVTPELPYNLNHLTFEFTGLCYTNPEKVKFKFKLQGQDNKWSPVTSERKAVFSNISPGTYTFELLAANNDGVWNKTPLRYTFTIQLPWWKRPWFIVLCILIIVLITRFIFIIRNRSLIRAKNILEQKVVERTAEVYRQKEEILSQHEFIEKKNKELKEQNLEVRAVNHELTSSIKYAKRIQNAIMPTQELMSGLFSDYFIIYKPRNIVSGDFYWAAKVENKIVISVADCTGHGVPGAFMSMLGTAFLNDIVIKEYITHPAVILRKLRKEIVRVLNQRGDADQFEMQMKDGMDIAVVSIDPENNELQFAGANNPCWIVQNNNLMELKPDKMPISIYDIMDKFTNHEMKFSKGDCLYLFSDGIMDQFGGPSSNGGGKKFKAARLKEIIIENNHLPMSEQGKIIEQKLSDWMNNYGFEHEQTDDITILGFRI